MREYPTRCGQNNFGKTCTSDIAKDRQYLWKTPYLLANDSPQLRNIDKQKTTKGHIALADVANEKQV